MQKHRRVLPLMAAFFVWLSLVVHVPAAAAEASWPAALGDTSNNVVLAQLNGNVTVAGCGSGTNEQRTFNASGVQTATLQQTDPMQYYTCSYWSEAAPDGTIYTVKATDPKYEVVAIRGGQVIGKPVRVSNLCSSNDTGHILGLRYTAQGVYVLVEHSNWPNCASRYVLARVDTQTGNITGKLAIQNSNVTIGNLAVGRNHLVVEGDQTINYVPYSLQASGVVSATFEARKWSAAQVATTFDSMSYVAHSVVTPNTNCGSSGRQYEKVTAYNEHNVRPIWTYKLPVCAYNAQIYAAPLDIAVLSYYVPLSDGTRRYEIVALGTSGTRMWQPHVLSSKTLKGNSYTNDQYAPILYIDNNGNVVVRRIYYTAGNYRMVGFQFISLFSGEMTDEYLTERALQPGESTAVADYAIGMTSGRLYFSMKQKLYMLPVARMGLDYPRAATYGIGPQPIRDAFYVALGDSFSSGEGVEPFLKDVPVCHRSTKAYPKLLDSDLAAKLALASFAACSGAVTDDVTNTDDGRVPEHGLPLQVTRLSDKTKVVTITIGGNDVEFKEYATSCVATLSPIGSCSIGSQKYQRTISLIRNVLPARLDKVYSVIKQRSTAKVYVIGYPQLVPAETIPAYPGTCRYLDDTERFAARNVVTNLNRQISEAVKRINLKGGNFKFVPSDQDNSPFRGHELCTNSAYFNGLSLPVDYSFHPNALGQSAFAELVKEAMAS
ncbi:MAG TPA: SGNH/GDSL hydrolase family protein [Candidatus Saccharimonadales bacterium]